MELLKQFKNNVLVKDVMRSGKTSLLAVSGGVDSMVLADLFLKAELPFAIGHCNFQLRGAESDKDEQLVQQWAEQHSVAFHSVHFDTKQKMEEWKKGVQETARILRYEWLDMLMEEHGYARLVTAHHANDNVETLLMNLFKGTGISGLHGIPEQNGRVVRPMLGFMKEDIYEYAGQHSVPFREDASNAGDAYTRNAIRNNILPVVEASFPNVVQHISRSIHRFAEVEQLYNKAIERERKQLMEQRGQDIYVPLRKLRLRSPLPTICYELFEPYGFGAAQLPDVLSLVDSESGHYLVSETHRLIRDRDFLIITALKQSATDIIKIEGAPGNIDLGHAKLHFSIEKIPGTIPAGTNIACLDLKNIEFPLTLRKWRQGDYFYPLGMGMKKKKIARYLIDQKLPLHEKEHVWVLESGKRIAWVCGMRIAWVCGMRIDERFKLRPTSEKMLMLSLRDA